MFGTWIGAILTLILFSFLYKDNPLYRLAENIFVGISTGYFIALEWQNVLKPNVVEKVMAGNWVPIIPAILGVVLLLQLSQKYGWIARYSIALYIGVGAALNMVLYTQGQLIPQIQGTMLKLNSISNIIIIVGTITSLAYFFFAIENKTLGRVSKIGIGFLMISFGAAYGTTVMGRVSLLIARFDFLINDWIRAMF